LVLCGHRCFHLCIFSFNFGIIGGRMKKRTTREILRDLIRAVECRDDPDEPAYEWQGLVDKLIDEAEKHLKETNK